MNWTLAVIQAIVIAGLSALISWLVVRKTKRMEFEFAYRNYILEKRKAAYDQLEVLLSQIFYSRIIIDYLHDPREIGWQRIEELERDVKDFAKNYIWLSPHILKQIDELFPFTIWQMRDLQYDKRFNDGDIDYINQTVVPLHEQFEAQKAAVYQNFIYDIATMHDIDTFCDEKSKQHFKDYQMFLR